jgi:hypothetical protein|nr:MAG TPA: hypothetical protein [Caudoviricetes sp.]
MKNQNTFFTKIMIALYGLVAIAFAILSFMVEAYTLYYYFTNDGFWAGIISLCTPVISSTILFFQLLAIEGITGTFSLLVLGLLITITLLTIPRILVKED